MTAEESILDDIAGAEVPASQFQQFLVGFTDFVLQFGMLAALYFLLPYEIVYKLIPAQQFIRYLVIFALFTSYRLISLVVFGKTIGMFICRTKFLNKHLLPLTLKEKLLTTFVTRGTGVKLYKM
ncbi:MAG: hypothetical protein EOO06_17915 [Chitinophagaceae bacterium]|nr:MAG: hypothetical protein EOO06_17915 [Chitinophagaceae bacterium]